MVVEVDLAPLYDAVIACVESDAPLADKFIDDVKKNVRLDDEELAIERLSSVLPSSSSKIQHVKETIDNSSYLIVFVSEKYIEYKSAFDKFVEEAVCLLSLFENTQNVLPLWVDLHDAPARRPFAIAHLNGCRYSTTDPKRNSDTWKRLKSDFTRKKDTMSHKRKLREQRRLFLKEKLDLQKKCELKRAAEQHQTEMEKLIKDSQRPVPKPRRGNNSYSMSESRSIPIPAPRSLPIPPTQVIVNINITSTDGGLSTGVLAGEHQPSLPDSTISSSTDNSSSVSASSVETRRTSTSSNATVDGNRGSQSLTNRTSSNRSSEAIADWDDTDMIIADDESHTLNLSFTCPESAKTGSSMAAGLSRAREISHTASTSSTTRYADQVLSELPSEEPTYSTAGVLPTDPRPLSELHE